MQFQFITLAPTSKNLTGQRFGRLIAIGPVAKDRNKHVVWLCRCDCGNSHNVIAQSLHEGRTRSCGCLYREDIGRRSTTHGKSHTKIYYTWQHMRMRCNDAGNKDYKYYGGRDITICPEWNASFESFYEHVSRLQNYEKTGYTFDRIDNDGNYEPGNVRWATSKQQTRNRRIAHMLTYDGETKSIAEWSEFVGIRASTIASRINAYGWTVERALTVPLYQRRKYP